MRHELRVLFASLGLVSLMSSPGLGDKASHEIGKEAFDQAISAVEKRDYSRLDSIISENPQALVHRTETGDDLFHEFVLVIYEDGISNGIDLTAIEILLDHGAVPHVSNGLLGAFLLEANSFDGDLGACFIDAMICNKSRALVFPIINRLIEVGAEFGSTKQEFRGEVVSEAFFYQAQFCQKPFVTGSHLERPSERVLQRLSTSTTRAEKEILLQLANEGSHDLACIVGLGDR